MSVEDQLKRLRIRRGQLKSLCTRAQNTLDSNAISTMSLTQLQERKAKIQTTWDQFENIQTKIELLEDSEELQVSHQTERSEFEETYFDLTSRFQELIISREGISTLANQPQNQTTFNTMQASNLRLPKITLPSFSGNQEEWYSFYDTFKSLIHNDNSITGIQKFHYLKSALRGEAAQVTQALEILSENYEKAWKLLKNRYDNKRLIVKKHIKALFELPSLSKENFSGLRNLVDGILKHTRVLRTIGRPVNEWDDLISYLATSKLDSITNKKWENSVSGEDIPTLQQLIDFLEHRCHILKAINKGATIQTSSVQLKVSQAKTVAHVMTSKNLCRVCKNDHPIFACKQFLRMSPDERFKIIKENKLCLNCLRFSSHMAKTCKAGSCKTCGKRHNTLLHMNKLDQDKKKTSVASEVTEHQSNSPATVVSHTANPSMTTQVLLLTALVKILDAQGKIQMCRALLDTGSQSNFITKDLVYRLGLTTKPINIPVVGFNQSSSQVREMASITIKSRLYDYSVTIDCLIINQISERLPNAPLRQDSFDIPKNLRLADPTFYKSTDVEMLLGAEVFWSILCSGQITRSERYPWLQKTLLGWIIGGSFSRASNTQGALQCNYTTTSFDCSALNNLEQAITKFWQVEQRNENSVTTQEERSCEEHFKQTHSRNEQGRFVVRLPLKQNLLQNLGNSYDIALKHFYSLEQKLNRNPSLKKKYTQFINEYLSLNYMHPVESENQGIPSYYIPHHAVVKQASTTTKLRVVFDASCSTDLGTSFNDALMTGPMLQQDVLSTLLKFRLWRYVLTANIEKMFRQVLIHKNDRSLQRILWRNEETTKIQTFELATVIYGTASAPFLAVRALQQIARLESANRPIGAARILNDFYVDDLVTGAKTIEDLIIIRDEIDAILKKAGFNLHKWASNQASILEDLPGRALDDKLHFNKDTSITTLGLRWNSNSDVFEFAIDLSASFRGISKRTILSNIAHMFDPLGLLGPVLITAKILLQRLWQLKVDWDEIVPLDIQTIWSQYKSELPNLDKL